MNEDYTKKYWTNREGVPPSHLKLEVGVKLNVRVAVDLEVELGQERDPSDDVTLPHSVYGHLLKLQIS